MGPSNPYARAAILARQTVERLRAEGHPLDAARHMVAAAINAEEYAVMKGRHPFDETRFKARLNQLPN